MFKLVTKCDVAQFTPPNEWLVGPLKDCWWCLYPVCCIYDSRCKILRVVHRRFVRMLSCALTRRSLVGLELVSLKTKPQDCPIVRDTWPSGSIEPQWKSELRLHHERTTCLSVGWEEQAAINQEAFAPGRHGSMCLSKPTSHHQRCNEHLNGNTLTASSRMYMGQ